MLTGSLAQDRRLADRTLYEVECLAAEIFATHSMMDWQTAIDEALASVRDLAGYAAEWDADAGAAAQEAQR